MLTYIVTLALLAVGVFSKNTNAGVNANYVVYQFGTGLAASTTYFPYALGRCQPGFTSTVGYKFTCSADNTTVNFQQWTNLDCTGTPQKTAVINDTYYGYNTSETEYRSYPGAFNCKGDDEYVTISFAASTAVCNGGSHITILASINSCIRIPSTNATTGNVTYPHLSIYGNYLNAELQYYGEDDTTCSGDTTKIFTANETCGFMFKFGSTPIYGYVINCTQNLTGGITGSSASMIGYGLTFLISLIVAMLN